MSEDDKLDEYKQRYDHWNDVLQDMGWTLKKIRKIPEVTNIDSSSTLKEYKKAVKKMAKLANEVDSGDEDEEFHENKKYIDLQDKAIQLGITEKELDKMPHILKYNDGEEPTLEEGLKELKSLIKKKKKKGTATDTTTISKESLTKKEPPPKPKPIEKPLKKKKVKGANLEKAKKLIEADEADKQKKKGKWMNAEQLKKYSEDMKKLRDEADEILKKAKEKKKAVNDTKDKITISTTEKQSKKPLDKQPAPPRKSKGERVRAVRSDKGQDHSWSDGREKTATYKANEGVEWSKVRCRNDTCWKTETRKTDATTKNKKAGDKGVYAYNRDNKHYVKQLRRKKKKD